MGGETHHMRPMRPICWRFADCRGFLVSGMRPMRLICWSSGVHFYAMRLMRPIWSLGILCFSNVATTRILCCNYLFEFSCTKMRCPFWKFLFRILHLFRSYVTKVFFLYFVGKSPAQVHVVPLAIYFWFWSLNVCRLCVESCFSVFSRADMSFVRAYVLFVLNLLFISIDMLLHIYSQTPCILLFRHVTAKSMPRHSCIQIFTHFCILVLVRLGMHDFRTILHVRDRSFNHLWFSHTFEFCDQMFGNLWFSYTFEFL